MKILKNKTYQDLLNKIEHLEKTRDDYYARIVKAEDLKDVLLKLSSMTINGKGFACVDGAWSTEFVLPDDVPRYVEDMLGGRVIKQEANKVIKISKNGDVTTGLTKETVDKGFSYKLIRE